MEILEKIGGALNKLDHVSSSDINKGNAMKNLMFYSDHKDLHDVQQVIHEYVKYPYNRETTTMFANYMEGFEGEWDFVSDKKEATIFKYLISEEGHSDLRDALQMVNPRYKNYTVHEDGSWGVEPSPYLGDVQKMVTDSDDNH